MDDERRRGELGAAPTTPAHDTAASGPDDTLDMPADAAAAAGNGLGPGAAIGHFIVKRRVGEGGMGVVLACEDADLGRPVAIKLLRSDADHPAYRERLLREAQAMARLEHGNVVKVYEVGMERGRLFVAMELVDGDTLTAWLREPRTWDAVRTMFLQIGAGLAAVHRAGLVHRDFKPDNVLVDRKGVARVADFGLARIELADRLTRTGVMMGTPGYMAPEQQIGGNVDARADQYSFCVALREALGGRPLDEARWQAVPSQVRQIATRGLAYDPADRFASLDELLAALRDARPARKRWLVGAIAVAVLGAAAGGIAVIAGSPGAHPIGDASETRVAPPSAPAPIDAGAPTIVAVVTPDAAALAPAPADAGRAPRPRAPLDVAPPAIAASPLDAGLPVIMPHSKHLPAAQVGDPGHLPIVRAAIKDLGYDGMAFDRPLDELARDLQREIDGATGSDLAIAQTKLGMVERRRGNCDAASKLWQDAADGFRGRQPDDVLVWSARSRIALALCSLGAGRPGDALAQVSGGWLHGNQPVVRLVMALATYDSGDKNLAYGLLLVASRLTDPHVQAALHAWLDGLGLSLE